MCGWELGVAVLGMKEGGRKTWCLQEQAQWGPHSLVLPPKTQLPSHHSFAFASFPPAQNQLYIRTGNQSNLRMSLLEEINMLQCTMQVLGSQRLRDCPRDRDQDGPTLLRNADFQPEPQLFLYRAVEWSLFALSNNLPLRQSCSAWKALMFINSRWAGQAAITQLQAPHTRLP